MQAPLLSKAIYTGGASLLGDLQGISFLICWAIFPSSARTTTDLLLRGRVLYGHPPALVREWDSYCPGPVGDEPLDLPRPNQPTYPYNPSPPRLNRLCVLCSRRGRVGFLGCMTLRHRFFVMLWRSCVSSPARGFACLPCWAVPSLASLVLSSLQGLSGCWCLNRST